MLNESSVRGWIVLQGCYSLRVADSDLVASLLIAMPQLEDPNFKRTVMLIVHHDEGGTFGLVLNRPADMSARDLCDGLDVAWGGDPSGRPRLSRDRSARGPGGLARSRVLAARPGRACCAGPARP